MGYWPAGRGSGLSIMVASWCGMAALDGGGNGGIECGLAPRVGLSGAWVMGSRSCTVSDGYRCVLCKQVYLKPG